MSKLRSVPRFAAVAIMLGACCLLGPADAQPNTQAPLPTIETPGRAAPSEQAPPASVPAKRAAALARSAPEKGWMVM